MMNRPDTHAPVDPDTRTPARLLWATAIVASALCVVAFVLWGIYGHVMLFDMIIALCM
jgi:hypothetical protein